MNTLDSSLPHALWPVLCPIALAIPFLSLGIAYLLWIRQGVSAHFGEAYDRYSNRDATRRRRCFERRCFQSAKLLYFSMLVAFVRGSILPAFPNLERVAIVLQVILLLGVVLSAIAARSRWLEPLHN